MSQRRICRIVAYMSAREREQNINEWNGIDTDGLCWKEIPNAYDKVEHIRQMSC